MLRCGGRWACDAGAGGLVLLGAICSFFFFNDTATTEIYTLSLHDALPILHRNISPSSIRIRGADGVAKLGDLILAKALEGTRAERLTKPGETVGELPFLAPESLFDEPMDIYSLGITAYTALAGKNPFLGKNVSETIANVINLKPPTLRSIDSSIPPSIENLLFRMIASQPDGRPSAPGDVASELQSILTAI